MDAKSVFVTVSLMMFANGGVLGLIHRDLPPALRPAALSWQIGTLLIAVGCALFAFEAGLPAAAMLTLVNGLFLAGLTSYRWALQQFHGGRPNARDLLPSVLAAACVFWFSAVSPNFVARVVAVSAVWAWLMASSMRMLAARPHRPSGLSRKMLLAIFAAVLVFTVARTVFFLLQAPVGADFNAASGASWMNLATPMFMTVLPVIGTTAFVLMCSDQLRRQWEQAASTDYLTGLANRRTLTEIGNERFRQLTGGSAGFAVAVLDIDAFKAINDTHGHEGGDRALKHVAAGLQACTRGNDLVARSGGEEFVVLFDDLAREAAEAAAERLRVAVQDNPFRLGSATIPITVSVGVAVHRPEDRSFADMLRRADKALYLAKAGGRNRVEAAA